MTRIDQARRKVRIARTAIGIGAAAGLAVFGGLARASHPASHTALTSDATARQTATTDESGDYFSGGGSDSYSTLGPSGSATPQVQSGGS